MEATEIRKLAALEDTHWWYRERRQILARLLRAIGGAPGTAIDIGAAGGGNTRVLKAYGWQPIAIEYGDEGAAIARDRGLNVVQADARHLPFKTGSVNLVVAFDVLEHIEEDDEAAAEIFRVLAPGGTALIAVPCDMRLWSAHDVAVGHVRRYTRDTLSKLITGSGLELNELWSWNVLLRPVAAWRRRKATESDLQEIGKIVNLGLSAIIAAERYLPVAGLPGVSLVLRATKPSS